GTLMVPCPWARDAVERFKDLDVGVHLTLTAEYPLYRWRSLTGARSLHGDDGYQPRTLDELYGKADLAEVEAECRAQIEQALSWGVDITHLDTHMGAMQIDPRFVAVYLKLAADYRLPLRMIGEAGDRAMGLDARARAAQLGIVFPDRFTFSWGRMMMREVFEDHLAKPRSGVSELMLHCVDDGPELRGYDLTEAAIRIHDGILGADRSLKARLDRAGVKTISFRPLRDLMRSEARAAA